MRYCFSLIFFLLCVPLNAQEWANVNRFKAANDSIIENQAGVELVFMGNSITEAWLRFDLDFFLDNNYVNRGISGQTSPQMLVRFKQDVIALNPKGVVVLAGTNDLAGNTGHMTVEEIFNQISSMADLAAAHQVQVYLCSVLPVYDYPWKPGLEPASKIVLLNKMLRDLCNSSGFIYVDYFSEMADYKNGLKAGLGADGVHPNEKGYEIMKKILKQTLNHSFAPL